MTIIFDVEIEKAIPDRKGLCEYAAQGILYCEGWHDYANMGLTVVSTYDIVTHLTRVFLKEDLAEFALYVEGKQTAGFNTRRFDMRLLAANDVELDGTSHYDILEQIWLAQGLDPDKFVPATHGGWGLDAVAEATLSEKKSGNGALAPVWWQQGKHGKVIDYCCRDSWLEGQLLLYIIQHDGIVTRGSDAVRVRPPDSINYASPHPSGRPDPGTDLGAAGGPGAESTAGGSTSGGLGIIR